MATVASSRIPGSPGSSPRLPSPPPMPEFQFGPQSPSVAAPTTELQADAPNKPDDTAQRRIRPGTKTVDMANGPPLVPLAQLDSAFQLQEHLKALYSSLTHGQSTAHTVPITRETAVQVATPPQLNDSESVDKNLWLYELCRFLTMKANLVSVALMADTPPCSSITCPEMRASEWQYLCAVHEPPKSCCAIDYVNHTLDWAANVLTSTKHFPSRLQLGGETGNVFQSMRQLTNIFRRVYRIFAHAWFQHREVFWHIETTYGIYVLFKTVCDKYQLIPEDNYTVPPEAEGARGDTETPVNTSGPEPSTGMQILRKENDQPSRQNGHDPDDISTTVSTGATTRRHKHTPSTGSHVATIVEGTEEEEDEQPPQPTVPSLSSSSPPKQNNSSPERPTPQSLGRLDIANTVPVYVPSKPQDPTPTTATSDRDPISTAGAFSSPPKPTNNSSTASTSTSTSVPSEANNPASKSSSEKSANINVKVRRDSGLESEIRSPTGGSLRTAGPDMLSAILGHIHGYDDAENEDENESEERKGAQKEEGDDDGAGKSTGSGTHTAVDVGSEAEKQHGKEGDVEDAKKDGDNENENENEEGEDENETMEEITLPDRLKSPDMAVVVGGAKEEARSEESNSKDA